MHMQTKTIELNGSTLYYRQTGEGPCVLLVHGFGEDGEIWHNQWDQLPGFRLLIPDLPGSGRSQLTADLSMEGMATTLRNLLAHEGIERCVLIGHSMGGYISLAFLEQYPELVTALGLFHSSAFADSESKKETREKGIAFVQKFGAALFLETATPNLYAPENKTEEKGLVQAHLNLVKDASLEALEAYYRAMMARPDRTHLLRDNKIPFLFVLGKYDQAVPLADGLQQAHLPLLTDVHLLQHSGHMGMVEEPQESNKLMQEFLSRIPYT